MSKDKGIKHTADETFKRWRATLKSHHREKEPQVRKLFRVYHQAEAQQNPLSWRALAQRAGLQSEDAAYYYCNQAGLPSLGTKYDPHYTLTPADLSMLERAAQTDLAAEDVLFFTGIKTHANRIREELNARRNGKVLAGLPRLSHKGITQRLASRAYREIDAGAEPKEVIRKVGITQRQFQALQEERDIIAPYIMRNLEVLLGRKCIQPYLGETDE